MYQSASTLSSENEAIACYQQIIKACEGRDYITQDLAIELQADEEEHRCLFEGFLKSLKKETRASKGNGVRTTRIAH